MLKLAFIFSIFVILEVNAQCPKFCTHCSSIITCSKCQQGHFLSKNFICPACPSKCQKCVAGQDDRPICLSCQLNFQLNPITGICFPCDPSCLTCSLNPNNCTSCGENQILEICNKKGSCIPIPNCPYQNCAQCSLDLNNVIYCSRCANGYFIFNLGCTPCQFPCTSCYYNQTLIWQNQTSAFWQGIIPKIYGINQNSSHHNLSGQNTHSFINGFNFSNMTISLIRGWTQAYFIYKAFHNATTVVNSTIQNKIMWSINYINSMKNQSYQKTQNNILNALLQFLGESWTLSQINNRILQVASTYTSCFQCSNGFAFNTTTQTCTKCHLNCQTCENSQCIECEDGFFLVNGTCYPCSTNCETCFNSATNCSSCHPPTSLSLLGTCIICQLPCASCAINDTSFCLTCHKPFSYQASLTGQCFRCKQDVCQLCSIFNTSVCLQCQRQYTLVNGTCQHCPNKCASCVLGTKTTCLECILGFTLINNTDCLPCPSGCLNCTQNQTCLLCQNGAFLNLTTRKCQSCTQGCSQCYNINQCINLKKGAVLFGNQIVNCRPGCQSCNPSKPDTCTQCIPRFYLVSGLDGISVCKLCSQGCLKCLNYTICETCLSNYILATGFCHKCSEYCQTCSPINLSECLICKRGFSLKSNGSVSICVSNCGQGCLQCHHINNSICLVCSQGYALSENNSQCIKCTSSCSGTCDPRNISICVDCVEGFEQIKNQCVRCPEGCLDCRNGNCSECKEGYTLVQQYFLNSFVCKQACNFPCDNCSASVCFSCIEGYILLNNSCKPNLSYFRNFHFCPIGAYTNISTNLCEFCPSNCASCMNQSICFQCFEGYALENLNASSSSCILCPFQCKTCYDNRTCKVCSEGYTKQILYMVQGLEDAVFNDKCVPCSTNCKTCLIEIDRCSSCYDGTYLFSHRCVNIYTVKYTYQIGMNYQSFMVNSESQKFIQKLSQIIQISINDHFIDSIKQGSTIVNGTISVANTSHANTVQNIIVSGSIPGYTILSSNSIIYFGDQAQQSNKYKPAPNLPILILVESNTGFLIGVSIGSFVIFIIVCIIVCKIKNKKYHNVNIIHDINTRSQEKPDSVSNSDLQQKNRYINSNIQIEVVTIDKKSDIPNEESEKQTES